MSVWWLWFTKEGEGFVGGCYVRGVDIGEAVTQAHRAGCNPGGQVMGVEIPDEAWEENDNGSELDRLYKTVAEIPGGCRKVTEEERNGKDIES